MTFKLACRKVQSHVPAEGPVEFWDWTLCKSDTTEVARSPRTYKSEREARAAVALTKKSMQGARFAKVEVTP